MAQNLIVESLVGNRQTNPRLKYNLRRELAINLGSLGIPLSFLAGFFIGDGKWLMGLSVMLGYILIDNITGRLWFWILEHLNEKDC